MARPCGHPECAHRPAGRQDRPDSDVDLLADLPPGMSLFDLGRVQDELEDILGTRVDLVAGTLKPEVRTRADHDLIPL
jgi:uncharacterized protein